MAENSKIAWTTHTFNPHRGCIRVSDGCLNCYAETLSHRNPGTLGIWGPEGKGTRVVAAEAAWKEVQKWNRKAGEARAFAKNFHGMNLTRPRIFCASLADVFEDWQGPMVDSRGTLPTSAAARSFRSRP